MRTRIYQEFEDHATIEDEKGNVLDAVTFSGAPVRHADPEEQRCFASGWAMDQLVTTEPMRLSGGMTYALAQD